MATNVIDPLTGERVYLDPVTGERTATPEKLREKAKGYREEYENIKSAEDYLENGKYGTPEEFGRSQTDLNKTDNPIQKAGRAVGDALNFPMQYGPGRFISKGIFEGKNLYNRENFHQEVGQKVRNAKQNAQLSVLVRQLKNKNPEDLTPEQVKILESDKITNQLKEAGKGIVEQPGQFVKGMAQDFLEYGPYYGAVSGLSPLKAINKLSPAKKFVAGTLAEEIPAQAIIDAPRAMSEGRNYKPADFISETILGGGMKLGKMKFDQLKGNQRREKLRELKITRESKRLPLDPETGERMKPEYDEFGKPNYAPLPEFQGSDLKDNYFDYTESRDFEDGVNNAKRPDLENIYREKYLKEFKKEPGEYISELSEPELKEQIFGEMIDSDQYERENLQFDFKRAYKDSHEISEEKLNSYANQLTNAELKEQIENPIKYEDYENVMNNYFEEQRTGTQEELQQAWDTRWDGVPHAQLLQSILGSARRHEGKIIGGKKAKASGKNVMVYGESFQGADMIAQEMKLADESELMEKISRIPTYEQFMKGATWPFSPSYGSRARK